MSDPWSEYRVPTTRPPAAQRSMAEQFYDDIAEAAKEREVRARQREIVANVATSPPPDTVARVTRIAREAGVNPLVAETDPDGFETTTRVQAIADLSKRYPAIGSWAANFPRGMAAAQDDTESLGLLGGAWDFIKKAPGRLVAEGIPRVGQLATDTWNAADEFIELGMSPLYAGMSALSQASGIEAIDPQAYLDMKAKARAQSSTSLKSIADRGAETFRGGNVWTEGLLAGVGTAPMTLAAVATRNPTGAAAIMGTLSGGGSYQEARRQGLDPLTALRYGATQGAIEGVTERIPAGTLVDLITKKVPFGKAFVRELGQEMTGEQLATGMQDLTDWAYLPENQGKTFGDYLRARPEAAFSTALAVVGGTATTVGGIGAAQRAADVTARVSDRIGQAQRAKQEAQFFDDAAKAAEGSKLRTRDPEAFRALLREQAEEAGATNVFVSAEAVREYQQSGSYDQRSDPFAKYDTDEAALAGGDIVVPIEDALTDLVGTPAWEAVKDAVRLSPGGMSAREATTFEEAMDDVMAEISDSMAKEAEAEKASRSVREKIVDQLAHKLGDAGFTSPVARQYAELLAFRAQTRASRLGKELAGVEFDNLRIAGVDRTLAGEALNAVEGDDQATPLQPHVDRPGLDAQQVADVAVSEALRTEADGLLSIPSLVTVLSAMRSAAAVDPQVLDRIVELIPVDVMDNLSLTQGAAKDLLSDETVLENAAALDAELPVAGGGDRAATVRLLVSEMARLSAEDVGALLSGGERLESDAALVTGEDRQFNDSSVQRATIRFRGAFGADQSSTTITLFENRNLSSFLHETAHMWLEELRFDAETGGNPQVFADWETVKAWFKRNGHEIGEDGQIPTEAHELWARSGERYLMEGKAPTTALTRLFETFRQWLVGIYKTVDALRAPITPEIREVFDRLIATDEEIAAARERQSLNALFTEAADLMSAPEFNAYRDQVENARAEAHSNLLDKTMRTIRQRETERYREFRKTIRAEEQERIDASPVFRAIAMMRGQRISKQWIVDEMGLDALDLLPVRVPPLYADGGVDPNIIAEQTGYAGARDMIEALIGAERAHRQAKEGGDKRSMRERAIETATDAEFQRRYGDPLTDGSIEREALAAVHSDMQGEVIASELRILSRKTGRRPTPYRIARDWARGKVRSGIVRDEASPSALQRYARNAAKAGREAEAAMLKGDVDETFRQKQFQMMNNALLAEAKQAADDVEAAVKRMDKIARAVTRKSIDQDYLEQAQSLLEAVDLRKRSQVGIDRQGQWEAWAAERQAEGFDIVVPGSFEATIGKTNWTRLSVDNLLALDETVKQVIHLGRLKQTLLDNAEEREWDEIYSEAEASADNIGRKPPKGTFTDPTWWDSVKSRAATMDAALLKMEQVFDWLDSGKVSGVFNRIVFRPIAAAQAREQDMTRDYFARVHEALEAVPKATVRHWGDRITVDLIDPETGLPAVMERKKLVAMALNWGNAGNRQRLADGYGWSQQGIEAALMDNLSEAEWRFVQQTWDIIDTLWPEIEKMERAINGVAPEKVEATEIVTPFGTFRGGYYPAIYDTTLDYTAEEHAGRKADLFEASYIRATTRASATKNRMEKVSRPILLDVGVINRHLGEVIHDVTHREAVMRAHKFLTSRRVMKAVDETLGPEVRKQFRPWLQHVANSWAQDRAGNEGLGKFMSKARANTTVVGMGWRFTTMLTQIAGYSNSFEKVGAKWVSAAIAQTAAHPIETFDFVMERSGEMRGRMDTIDRDIRAEMTRLGSKLGAAAERLTAAKRFAFHGIGYMDRAVSIPTWIGAYNKAISEGLTEEEAAYAGDKSIRLSQGAAGPKDLAAVATGQGRFGEAFKWLTMFYSYLSTVYSRQRNLGRDVAGASASDLPALMTRAWWLIVVPPLLAELLSGRGPDDDEDPAWWAFQRMLSQSLGAIPGVRDLAEPALAGATGGFTFGYRLSPVTAVGESVVKVSKDVGRLARGEDTKRATRNVLEMTGYITGLVPGQLAASTQFLVDVGAGEADPETIAEWYEGLTKGRIKED